MTNPDPTIGRPLTGGSAFTHDRRVDDPLGDPNASAEELAAMDELEGKGSLPALRGLKLKRRAVLRGDAKPLVPKSKLSQKRSFEHRGNRP